MHVSVRTCLLDVPTLAFFTLVPDRYWLCDGDGGGGDDDGGAQPPLPEPATHRESRSTRVEPNQAQTFSCLIVVGSIVRCQCSFDLPERTKEGPQPKLRALSFMLHCWRDWPPPQVPQYIPSIPPLPAGTADLASGSSTTSASVVRSRPAIDAAFSSAVRVTLVGSMTPALTRSS